MTRIRGGDSPALHRLPWLQDAGVQSQRGDNEVHEGWDAQWHDRRLSSISWRHGRIPRLPRAYYQAVVPVGFSRGDHPPARAGRIVQAVVTDPI